MVARRIGHDLHLVKRRPTKEATTPVLRSVALKGIFDTRRRLLKTLLIDLIAKGSNLCTDG
jgi:hypothetical protein